MRGLIVTADDFGLDPAVNEAVEQAHCHGILTAASLMMAGPASNEAVAIARRLPSLRVGLHVVVVDGRPMLPPGQVPALVGDDGRLRSDLFRCGWRYFADPAARRQLRAEIAAQFEAFRSTGLMLDHVNAHNHMHVHPTVFAMLIEMAQQFGSPPIRIPYEPPIDSWRVSGRGLTSRLIGAAGLSPWFFIMRRRLQRAGLRANDRLFGRFDSGAMDEPMLLRIIERLSEGVTEIYLHPAARHSDALAREMPGYHGESEFRALLSGRVRDRIEHRGIKLGGYTDLLPAVFA